MLHAQISSDLVTASVLASPNVLIIIGARGDFTSFKQQGLLFG